MKNVFICLLALIIGYLAGIWTYQPGHEIMSPFLTALNTGIYHSLSRWLQSLKHLWGEKEPSVWLLKSILIVSLVGAFYYGCQIYLARALSRLEPPYGWTVRVKKTILEAIIGILPLFSLLLSWLILTDLLALDPGIRDVLTLILTISLFIRLTLTLINRAIAGDPTERLIPCPEGFALYSWPWAKRIVYYAGLGYLTIALMDRTGIVVRRVIPGLWTLYLSGLFCLFTLSLLGAKGVIRERLSIKVMEDGRGRRSLCHLYNLAIGKLYSLLLLYLLILSLAALLGYSTIAFRLMAQTLGSLLVLILTLMGWRLIGLLYPAPTFIEAKMRDRPSDLEPLLNKYLFLLQFLARLLLFLSSSLLILRLWGIPLANLLFSPTGAIIIQKVVTIGLTILLALLLIDVSQYLIKRQLLERSQQMDKGAELSKRVKTFLPLLNNLVKYVTFFIAAMIVLEQLGIDITPILAGAGVVGLAVGFGAQSLVKDVISGFFILFEDLISVGDVVIIKGTGGLVEEVNLRAVKMRDLAGNVHVIPNSNIDMITNMTKEYSRYVLDLGVSYREDIDEVIEVVKEVAEELRADPNYGPNILEPLEVLGVDDFAESQVTIKFRITTKPIKQWEVGRELRRRIKKAFDAKGIEIPFPHRTIYFGDPKYTTPQPLFIRLETIPDPSPPTTGADPKGRGQ